MKAVEGLWVLLILNAKSRSSSFIVSKYFILTYSFSFFFYFQSPAFGSRVFLHSWFILGT